MRISLREEHVAACFWRLRRARNTITSPVASMTLCISLNSYQLCGGFSDILSVVFAVGLCFLAWVWVVSPLLNSAAPGKPVC